MPKIITTPNGMQLWKDANGRWHCRAPAAADVVYRSGARSYGTERIRRKLWGRRRDADDSPLPPAVVGNCGRPADQPCGLLNPSECATHAELSIDQESHDASIRRLIVRGHRAKLRAPVPLPANESRAEQLLYIQRLRERHGLKRIDPRVVAADCAHRIRQW
jgi:hypothetical protein